MRVCISVLVRSTKTYLEVKGCQSRHFRPRKRFTPVVLRFWNDWIVVYLTGDLASILS
jgi:hypothetical protein